MPDKWDQYAEPSAPAKDKWDQYAEPSQAPPLSAPPGTWNTKDYTNDVKDMAGQAWQHVKNAWNWVNTPIDESSGHPGLVTDTLLKGVNAAERMFRAAGSEGHYLPFEEPLAGKDALQQQMQANMRATGKKVTPTTVYQAGKISAADTANNFFGTPLGIATLGSGTLLRSLAADSEASWEALQQARNGYQALRRANASSEALQGALQDIEVAKKGNIIAATRASKALIGERVATATMGAGQLQHGAQAVQQKDYLGATQDFLMGGAMASSGIAGEQYGKRLRDHAEQHEVINNELKEGYQHLIDRQKAAQAQARVQATPTPVPPKPRVEQPTPTPRLEQPTPKTTPTRDIISARPKSTDAFSEPPRASKSPMPGTITASDEDFLKSLGITSEEPPIQEKAPDNRIVDKDGSVRPATDTGYRVGQKPKVEEPKPTAPNPVSKADAKAASKPVEPPVQATNGEKAKAETRHDVGYTGNAPHPPAIDRAQAAVEEHLRVSKMRQDLENNLHKYKNQAAAQEKLAGLKERERISWQNYVQYADRDSVVETLKGRIPEMLDLERRAGKLQEWSKGLWEDKYFTAAGERDPETGRVKKIENKTFIPDQEIVDNFGRTPPTTKNAGDFSFVPNEAMRQAAMNDPFTARRLWLSKVFHDKSGELMAQHARLQDMFGVARRMKGIRPEDLREVPEAKPPAQLAAENVAPKPEPPKPAGRYIPRYDAAGRKIGETFVPDTAPGKVGAPKAAPRPAAQEPPPSPGASPKAGEPLPPAEKPEVTLEDRWKELEARGVPRGAAIEQAVREFKEAGKLKPTAESRAAAEAERTRPGSDNPQAVSDRMASAIKTGSEAPPAESAEDIIARQDKLTQSEIKLVEARLNRHMSVDRKLLARYRAQVGIHPNDPEAGFLSFRRRSQPTPVPNPSSPIGQITSELNAMKSADPGRPITERAWEGLKDKFADTGDAVHDGIVKLNLRSAEVKDRYLHIPEWTDFRRAIGKWTGDTNRNAAELLSFTKAIKDKFPDKATREAITNYVQANGDRQTLQDRANHAALSPRLRRGYERALNLSPDAKNLADNVRKYFDSKLTEAQNLGILHHGLENYVNQIWKSSPYRDNLIAAIQGDGLKTRPDFSKQRFYESYFEGEKQGLKPRDKDIGYLITAYDQAFNQTVSSRAFVRALHDGVAKDGRPLVEVRGIGKVVSDPRGNNPDAVLVNPHAHPKGTADYKELSSHPALRDWTWVSNIDGHDVFQKGDMLVHPEIAKHLEKILAPSGVRQYALGRAALRLNTELKGSMFAFSTFHQVQEGVHAMIHKVNPFHPPELDWSPGSTLNKLVDHGLQLMDFSGQEHFAEGLGGTGIYRHLPIAGDLGQRYQSYLFNSYLPRLKGSLAEHMLERNMSRYADMIKRGELTEDQVIYQTAQQANAAMGGLNYKMMGRSKTTQDLFRLVAIAPDFLEARTRFLGQALKPFGKEQSTALLRGALVMYAGARLLNQAIDGDPHYDKPFSLIINGYEYNLRSVPGDVYNAWNDFRQFSYHRMSPTTLRPGIELATGRDEFGRQKSLGAQTLDFIKNFMPVSGQGALNKFGDSNLTTTMLEATGIHRSKYYTPAERMAHQIAMNKIPPGFESKGITHLATRIYQGSATNSEIDAALNSGKLSTSDLRTLRKDSRESPFLRDFKQLTLAQMAQVFAVAKDEEKAQVARVFNKKRQEFYKLSPAEQEEAAKYLNKLE